ncbi:sulfate adenylyltransferase subunit CysN [Porticoccus sp. GXU_MW_L64]
MTDQTELIKTDILGYLKRHEQKDILRFITCGSVDDGKSTLIGRLLHDSKMIYEDQLAAIENDSKKVGTTGDQADLALLVDGLQSEREQGITIDVAYRFFSTEKRKFIIADTPGHEQYTRNMATGASSAQAAVILIDARQGVKTQTRRHSYICSLLGIKHFIVAINKMDLVGYSKDIYEAIKQEYLQFSSKLDVPHIHFIPLSALTGDNVVSNSTEMSWYEGSAFLPLLESIDAAKKLSTQELRLAIQYVNRPNLNFRGYCGTLASGILSVGQKIKILPSDNSSTVKAIYIGDNTTDSAHAGQSVTVTLQDDIDISRGDVIISASEHINVGNEFDASIVWMHNSPLTPGKLYDIKLSTTQTSGMISAVEWQVDINTLEHLDSESLEINDIGQCRVKLTQDVTYDLYSEHRSSGSFIIIDRLSNITVGAGMINSPYQIREHDSKANVVWNKTSVTPDMRTAIKPHAGRCIWLTGLSGSGKSTIANALELRLNSRGYHTFLLDGDNVRHGLCKDLTMSDDDRTENIRRIAEVAKLMTEAGLIVMTAFISPFTKDRNIARELFTEGEFIEVFVDTPLEVCEKRDPKGLYKKARAGIITNFTGVDSEYQHPSAPEIHLKTESAGIESLTESILKHLKY